MIPWHTEKGMAINHIHGYGGMGKESFPKAMADAGIPMKSDRLRITEYINDMDVCLAAADLVICRSGASTLAELEAAGFIVDEFRIENDWRASIFVHKG